MNINGEARQSWQWRHWGCTTPIVIKNMKKSGIETGDDLDGFDELDSDLQAKVETALKEGSVDPADIPESAKKVEEPELDEDGEPIEPKPKVRWRPFIRQCTQATKRKATKKPKAEDDDDEDEEKVRLPAKRWSDPSSLSASARPRRRPRPTRMRRKRRRMTLRKRRRSPRRRPRRPLRKRSRRRRSVTMTSGASRARARMI